MTGKPAKDVCADGSPSPSPSPRKNGARGRALRWCDRWWGTERVRHIPFAPRAGRRCRQADEGRVYRRSERATIFGIILTIWSNMLQNEADTCYFEGKLCI
ncbi:hypothetical protein EHI48_12195 [Rhizobium sp. WSM1325]|nr:hypothetical protein EHI48_12195 [Rhizobium leguminosarum]